MSLPVSIRLVYGVLNGEYYFLIIFIHFGVIYPVQAPMRAPKAFSTQLCDRQQFHRHLSLTSRGLIGSSTSFHVIATAAVLSFLLTTCYFETLFFSKLLGASSTVLAAPMVMLTILLF